MRSSADGLHQGQLVQELNTQTSLLHWESKARHAAEQQAKAAKKVAEDLSRKLQLREQVGATAAAARAHSDSNQYLEERMTDALATIIKLQEEAEMAQEKFNKMHNLHILQSEMLEQQALQLENPTSEPPDVEATQTLFLDPWDPDAIADCMPGGTLPYSLDHARKAIELLSNRMVYVSDQCRDVQKNIA
jgi:23S rRNA maturation mini-RNase III